jgi:hypothetical protein
MDFKYIVKLGRMQKLSNEADKAAFNPDSNKFVYAGPDVKKASTYILPKKNKLAVTGADLFFEKKKYSIIKKDVCLISYSNFICFYLHSFFLISEAILTVEKK